MLIICLEMSACSSHDDEPESVSPMQFSKRDYTIIARGSNGIPFTGGGDVYKLEASNPEILGKFGIDIETHTLIISPVKAGVSTLNIIDVDNGTTVTLNITVEDYYLPFKIIEIEGTNTNKFFTLEIPCSIRFIRNDDNTKPVKVVWKNPSNFNKPMTKAEGFFDISRSDTNIFTMTLSLQGVASEQTETFEYTMGGDGEYMKFFDRLFDFNWDPSIASSRSSQPRVINMILTDNSNGCRITCEFQPLKFDY